MYHTYLWLCKYGDEKSANSAAAEILACVYLPLSPVANNISPNVVQYTMQHNKQCKRNIHTFTLAFKQAREAKQPLNTLPNVLAYRNQDRKII